LQTSYSIHELNNFRVRVACADVAGLAFEAIPYISLFQSRLNRKPARNIVLQASIGLHKERRAKT
jgi:hypothetical protein